MQIVTLAQVAALPWKNGGGLTRELWCWPAAPAAWQLRVSVAEVARSGPFSAYPGVARAFCVLQGAGVRLHFPDRDHTLTPASAALHFNGALAPTCTLLDGPTLDLNLMARPAGTATAMTRAVPGRPWAHPAPLRAVFSLHPATLHRAGHVPVALHAASLACSSAARGEAWHLHGQQRQATHAWWLACTPLTP